MLGGGADMTMPELPAKDTNIETPEATIAQAISMLESVAGQKGYEDLVSIIEGLKAMVGSQSEATPAPELTPETAGAGQKI
jgi:hypothetical protein